MTLSATGTLSYNGHTFTAFASTSVRITPVWDSANRIITCNRYDFHVRDYVSNSGSSTDSLLSEMRLRLTEHCKALHYDAKGLGSSLTVNGTGGTRDVMWGPKPQMLSYAPVGNNLGARIEWSCTTHIPDCDQTGDGRKNPFMAISYDVSWDINDEGLTTRTISGEAEVPMTASGTVLGDPNADTYRLKIRPNVPLTFRRVSQRFSLSADRRKLHFSFVDVENHYALPDGVARMHVTHSIHSDLSQGFFQWGGSLTGTVTMARDNKIPKSAAFDKFMMVVRSRIGEGDGGAIPKVDLKGEGCLMLQGFEVSEDVFTRTTTFGVRYTYIGVTLKEILKASNLWQPIAGTDFKKWRTSLEKNVHAPRGLAGMTFENSDEKLVTICMTPGDVEPNNEDVDHKDGKEKGDDEPIAGGAKVVPKDKSWIKFDVRVELHEDDHIAIHKPLTGANKTKKTGKGTDVGKGKSYEDAAEVPGMEAKSTVGDFTQRVCAPTTYVHVVGQAARLEHQIATPKLETIGGAKLEFIRKIEDNSTPVAIAGSAVPVFVRNFHLVYLAPEGLDSLPSPASPAMNAGAYDDVTPSGDISAS